jgi:hypothetical protein
MRVKTTNFTSGQFATFEAASVGMQWQFADGDRPLRRHEEPLMSAGVQVLGNSERRSEASFLLITVIFKTNSWTSGDG